MGFQQQIYMNFSKTITVLVSEKNRLPCHSSAAVGGQQGVFNEWFSQKNTSLLLCKVLFHKCWSIWNSPCRILRLCSFCALLGVRSLVCWWCVGAAILSFNECLKCFAHVRTTAEELMEVVGRAAEYNTELAESLLCRVLQASCF